MSARMFADPDLQALSDKAFRYWVNAIAWCALYESDGVFRFAGRTPKYVQELVTAGRFKPTEDEHVYAIVAWERWQISQADLEARRQRARENGKKGGRPPNPKPKRNQRRLASGFTPKTQTKAELEVEGEEDSSVEPNGSTGAAAPHKLLFGDICAAFGYQEPLDRSDRSEIGGVAKALLDKGLEPGAFADYIEWLTTDPHTPLVAGKRLTLHSLPRWVKDFHGSPRVITPRKVDDRITRLVQELS